LREFGGLSYGELSAALAVSGAAVESLLFRARHRLRGQLRTAYASVSGASWIDALVRLFAGGGAPIAAKVAVLGAGAAVVGSTAVVVPNVLDNHRPSHSTRAPAAVVHRSKAAAAPLLIERVVRTTPVRAAATRVRVVQVSNSNEQDAEQDHASSSQPQHAQPSEHDSHHATRAETSIDHASSGDGGDGQSSDQQGDGSGDGSSPTAGSPSTTIPELPALPPVPPATPSDGEGN
jgi:hypothetical protein